MSHNDGTGDEGGISVVVEARYAAGDAVLIGSGAHWLLMTDPGDDAVVDEVWQALGDPSGAVDERVLEIVERAFGGTPPAFALVDFSTGAPAALSRGDARVRVDGPARILSVDGADHAATDRDRPSLPARRRLVAGVASASHVELRPVTRVAPATPTPTGAPAAPTSDTNDGSAPGPLIDGIPEAILAAKGPDGPPPPRAPVVRRDPEDTGPSGDTTEPTPGELPERIEEGGHTTIRPARAGMAGLAPAATQPTSPDVSGPVPPADPPDAHGAEDHHAVDHDAVDHDADDHDGATVHRPDVDVAGRSDHLEHHTGATVLAFTCPLGHLTPTTSPACRTCHQRVAPQEPQRVTRPVLGGLRLPTGEVVPLDRGVVIGRKPAPVPGSNDWPHLVHLPSGQSFVSRLHLHIELDGWDVLARDLNSRGGSMLTAPGRETVRMQPGEAYVLEPGTVIDLAEVYEVRFETGRVAGR